MTEEKKIKKKTSTKKKKKASIYSPSLKKIYSEEITTAMQKQFNYSNKMEVPRVTSISLNMGLGDAKTNSKNLESAVEEMTLISGQKPIITKSKKDSAIKNPNTKDIKTVPNEE